MPKPNKVFNMKETDYDEVLTANSFEIVIKCRHCQAIGCFIGIEDLGMNHDGVVNIDLVCANCGHVENCY